MTETISPASPYTNKEHSTLVLVGIVQSLPRPVSSQQEFVYSYEVFKRCRTQPVDVVLHVGVQ